MAITIHTTIDSSESGRQGADGATYVEGFVVARYDDSDDTVQYAVGIIMSNNSGSTVAYDENWRVLRGNTNITDGDQARITASLSPNTFSCFVAPVKEVSGSVLTWLRVGSQRSSYNSSSFETDFEIVDSNGDWDDVTSNYRSNSISRATFNNSTFYVDEYY